MRRQLQKMILIRPVVMLILVLGIAAFIVMRPETGRTAILAQQSGTATPAEEATSTPAEEAEATATPAEEATSAPAEEGATEESAPEEVREATPTSTPAPLSDDELLNMGEEAYGDYCAACHQADGQGIPNAYPALAGNAFVLAEDPTGILRVIFTGRAGIPHFRDALSSQEIAAILSYVRNNWDNDASIITAEAVEAVSRSSKSLAVKSVVARQELRFYG